MLHSLDFDASSINSHSGFLSLCSHGGRIHKNTRANVSRLFEAQLFVSVFKRNTVCTQCHRAPWFQPSWPQEKVLHLCGAGEKCKQHRYSSCLCTMVCNKIHWGISLTHLHTQSPKQRRRWKERKLKWLLTFHYIHSCSNHILKFTDYIFCFRHYFVCLIKKRCNWCCVIFSWETTCIKLNSMLMNRLIIMNWK